MNKKNDYSILINGEVFFTGSIRTAEKVFDCLVDFKNQLELSEVFVGPAPVIVLTACKYIV